MTEHRALSAHVISLVGRFKATHVSPLLNPTAEEMTYVLITGGILLLLEIDGTPQTLFSQSRLTG
jgi:hypothetical protein